LSKTNRDETRDEAVSTAADNAPPADATDAAPPAGDAADMAPPADKSAGAAPSDNAGEAPQPDAAALEKAVQELEEQLKAERDKFLRLAAEYDNYRKRTAKERESLFSEIRADTIAQILPVYDNIARALKQPCSDEAYFRGIQLIMAQFEEIFKNLGVKEIPAVGEKFDVSRHYAVQHIEDPAYGESVVVEEYEKGFMIGDKVIRFSTVKVAN